jgi:hypothetical protein
MRIILASGFIVLLAAAPWTYGRSEQDGSPKNILTEPIDGFSAKGDINAVIKEIANRIRREGVLGFARSLESTRIISITQESGTVGDVLDKLVQENPGYKIVKTSDPQIINILSDTRKESQNPLDLQIKQFDMAIDDWPQNWYMRLPEFCPEVSRHLRQRYTGRIQSDGAGANLEGNVRPPHVEFHLRNVSVRDILNTLAKKSIELSREKDGIAPGTLFPVGWEYFLPETDDGSFESWQRRVFSALP